MKNVLVTGGTRGLGLAITRRLSLAGYHVVAAGRKLSPELSALLGPQGLGKVSFHQIDLGQVKRLHEDVKAITTAHGHLYGLVNNGALGHEGVLATMHESQIEELVTVNLTGTLILTKYAVRSMLLNGLQAGRIINVASIIATTGFSGLSVYAATKAGLVGFSRSLAREVGKAGITVNSLSPGYMETDMTAGLQGEKLESIKRRSSLGRLATVDDASSAVEYLLSPAAAAVTGTNLTVDAGSTA